MSCRGEPESCRDEEPSIAFHRGGISARFANRIRREVRYGRVRQAAPPACDGRGVSPWRPDRQLPRATRHLSIRLWRCCRRALWLIIAKPDLAKNYGKAYMLDATRFTSSDKRAQAFEAGAIDLSSGSASGVIFAAAEGVTARFIASISRESARGFSTSFYVKESSPVRSVPDLRGKMVGINGFSTAGHLWLKAALGKHGLTEADVRIAPIPFPAMQESLEAGGRSRSNSRSPTPHCGEADEGAENIRCEIRGPIRRGVDVLVGKDEFLKKNAGRNSGIARGSRGDRCSSISKSRARPGSS